MIVVLVLAVLLAAGVNIVSRKAPQLLRKNIERALNKTVNIRTIEYHFPWNFELSGVEIRETHAPFTGEICFAVDKILLDVSPLSLSQKNLIIDRAKVQEALIVIRHREGKLYHVLSDAAPAPGAGGGASAVTSSATPGISTSVTK